MLLTQPLSEGTYSLTPLLLHGFLLGRQETSHLWFLQALIYIYLLFPLLKALYDSPKAEHRTYLFSLVFLFTFGGVAQENLLHVGSYLLQKERYLQEKINIGGYLNPFTTYFSFSLFYFLLGGIISDLPPQNRTFVN
ncbi:hypothetical protein GCM10027443_00920 [Pontibacter brevis]